MRDFRVEDYPEVESLWDLTGLPSIFKFVISWNVDTVSVFPIG